MRLIDADQLKTLFEKNDDVFTSQDIRHIIDVGAKTIDALPIIRCANCTFGTNDSSNLVVHCDYLHEDYPTWFYCVMGKEKSNTNI